MKQGADFRLPVSLPFQKVNVFINRRSAQIAHPRQLAHIQLLIFVCGIMAEEHGGNIVCGCLRSADLDSLGLGICHPRPNAGAGDTQF